MCCTRGRVIEIVRVSVHCVMVLVIFTQSHQLKCSSPPIKKASAWACSSRSKSCDLHHAKACDATETPITDDLFFSVWLPNLDMEKIAIHSNNKSR